MSETTCERCGCAAVGGSGSQDARMMRRAKKGVCANCAAVIFLKRLSNMHGGALGDALPNALRLPHIQLRFASVMRAGKADAKVDEINWERVIEVWNIGPDVKDTLF